MRGSPRTTALRGDRRRVVVVVVAPVVKVKGRQVVAGGHQEHAPHDFRGAHPFGARDAPEQTPRFHVGVHVFAVGPDAGVVAVHHEVDLAKRMGGWKRETRGKRRRYMKQMW
jgi:hypothetical protein